VIQGTLRLVRRLIDPRIALEARVAPDLWVVHADRGQVGQVLMNLCLNARDAMPEGGQLELSAENVVVDEDHARLRLNAQAGEFVRLQVHDTGHGIAPEVLPHIFEPFFTTKEPGKGSGLGLALVFGIVRKHGGWIECSSEVGKGTRFEIYLPRSGKSTSVTSATRQLPHQGTETILLVDDEPAVRQLGRAVLERYGYQVLLAADGLEGLETYQREKARIGLVILDMRMPQMSGAEVFQRLVALEPGVRVLFASGYSEGEEVEGEQIQGRVNKPYHPNDLAQAVRLALDARRPGTSGP
jgi:CheY-like chemotaxis protein